MMTEHRIKDMLLTCSCGMTVTSVWPGAGPERTLQDFSLWVTRFLCQHEAVANGEAEVGFLFEEPTP